MYALRRLRGYIACLALCAMCFGVAAPVVSKWLAATQGIVWVQVCSATGHEDLAVSTTPNKAPATSGNACPYCALVHHSPFVPAVATTFTPRIAIRPLAYVNVAINSLHVRTERRMHTARAPPALT